MLNQKFSFAQELKNRPINASLIHLTLLASLEAFVGEVKPLEHKIKESGRITSLSKTKFCSISNRWILITAKQAIFLHQISLSTSNVHPPNSLVNFNIQLSSLQKKPSQFKAVSSTHLPSSYRLNNPHIKKTCPTSPAIMTKAHVTSL